MGNEDFVSLKAIEEAGAARMNAIKKEGALRLFGNLAINAFSPFAPTMANVDNRGMQLSREAHAREAEFVNQNAAVRINTIKKKAAKKASSFNAYAAAKGTLPQTVANLYLARIMQPATEAIAYINLQTARTQYLSAINELSDNYSMQNECANALHAIKQSSNFYNQNLLHTVFDTATKYLFNAL